MLLIADLLKVILPAALVLYAMYLMVQAFLNNKLQEQTADLRQETHKTLLPLRLQAYERLTLFLERISPNQLLVRTNGMAETVAQYQQLLTKDIREEFTHNLVQQLYVKPQAWEAAKRGMEETVTLINLAARELSADAPAMDLAKKIFEMVISKEVSPSEDALKTLKENFDAEMQG